MYCLFCVVLCIACVYMYTVLLPPGGYPVSVEYIASYHMTKLKIDIRNYANASKRYVILSALICTSDVKEQGIYVLFFTILSCRKIIGLYFKWMKQLGYQQVMILIRD